MQSKTIADLTPDDKNFNKIVRVEDGELYDSKENAAIANGLKKDTIKKASENIMHAHNTGLWKSRRQVPIRCVETGELFDSVNEAARHFNMFEGSISQSIRKGYASYGLHFRKVTK